MDVNAYPSRGHAAGSAASAALARPKRADVLPEAGPLGTFGAVTGHDGSGAPLPPIGPYDFSAAQRVHDAHPAAVSKAAVRLSFEAHAQAPQYVVSAFPSAWHATRTWLASRLFGALGLATPTAMLVRGCSLAFDGTQAPERIYLATTYLPIYRPLGKWLEGEAAWRAIEGADGAQRLQRTRGGDEVAGAHARNGAREAGRRMAQVLAQSGGAPVDALTGASAQAYADATRMRHDMRGVLCGCLPDVYQCALARQYVAALWLGNRDLCRDVMKNVGVWRDKNDLPYMMTVDFRDCLDAGLQGTLADLTPFCGGAPLTAFIRRLTGLSPTADSKTVLDELKNPTGARALAAEMAFRLGRISAHDIVPWVDMAHDVARVASRAGEATPAAEDRRDFVNHLLDRRDRLVTLLGGAWAAQAWTQLYPTRARAIEAHQAPFLGPVIAACDRP
ncbi:hypothetical protein PEP31012_04448 [Pandoraea eparura]|uniref:Uncharacterized protein n=1 Tax=Pandoraea eparura TaxID=2508291 RepID=A0A5E4YBN5_9BURK|nr:hypothetical protein [Pandoraea eparura]VVE46146.1 hypothetical protein PEP31012_04448 [Pandoraea eparura]